ncbi:MAG: nucleotide exchange factor GrpE [Clostridia bacterium]|nr:nucleotide exchange factor GrpE [Clostridia bacterium]
MEKENLNVQEEQVVASESKKNAKKKNNDKELQKTIEKLTLENEKLTSIASDLEKKAEEYKQSWYRTAADFENFKKRNNETRINAYADGKNDAIKSILIVGDNLDRALLTIKDEQTKAGVELVNKQFGEILSSMGVEEVNPVGELFDPNLHEAIHQVESENPEDSGKIQSVFKKGYSLNGKMIRYAQVVVIK